MSSRGLNLAAKQARRSTVVPVGLGSDSDVTLQIVRHCTMGAGATCVWAAPKQQHRDPLASRPDASPTTRACLAVLSLSHGTIRPGQRPRSRAAGESMRIISSPWRTCPMTFREAGGGRRVLPRTGGGRGGDLVLGGGG